MSVEYRSEEERLVAEQAIGLYRSVLAAMHSPPTVTVWIAWKRLC